MTEQYSVPETAEVENETNEMSEAELDVVSGGLNPQPLPPRYLKA